MYFARTFFSSSAPSGFLHAASTVHFLLLERYSLTRPSPMPRLAPVISTEEVVIVGEVCFNLSLPLLLPVEAVGNCTCVRRRPLLA